MAVERSIITPPDMAKPRGYSYGVEVRGGSTLYIAGQVAFDPAGKVVGAAFLIELGFLKGRERLPGYDLESLIVYE
ncbi:MAG: hypothetical protein HYS69_11870 [candidate division NC10 bacterium]|nr:hypothetical protein [candidate division NC10 bacterium]